MNQLPSRLTIITQAKRDQSILLDRSIICENIPTFNKNDDVENIDFNKACPIELPETKCNKVETRSSSDLKMDSSGKPVFGLTESSTKLLTKSKTKFQPSRQSSQKLSHVKSKPVHFNVNEIMQDALGVHSLTNYTYKEQQLVEEAVNRCKYKDQSLEWYDNVDINAVKIASHFDAAGSDADVYNDDEEEFDYADRSESSKWYNDKSINAVDVESYFGTGEFLPEEEETVVASNLSTVNWLESPYEYSMYDGIRAQMDGGAKCIVTNKIELLHDIRFYSKLFPPKVKMKGATSNNIIVPVAEGFLKVPTIHKDVFLKIKCYYSLEFTSTLLPDNDILKELQMKKDYCEQLMMRFFEQAEIDELPVEERDKIRNQKLDDFTRTYDHNYGNYILCCTHKRKFNRNIYVPGVIRNGLCYTMPLMISRKRLPADFKEATVVNSFDKAYQEDLPFRKACDAKAVELIYKHQEREHLELMQILESVPKRYHSLPFSSWIKHNTPVHALTEKAHEMLWHQRLIHLSPQSIQNAHKFVDGVPNLSKFSFDDIDQCPTCIDANLRKNSPGKRSLSELYMGLFVDFAFPGKVACDKEGKVIELSREDIEGLNGESSWILITNAQTKMIHGDARTSKASPLKYLESFLEEYSPNVSNKFVFMDQGGELWRNSKVRNLFRKYKYQLFPTGLDSSK